MKTDFLRNKQFSEFDELIKNWNKNMTNIFQYTNFESKNLYKGIQELQKMKESKIFFSFTANLISPLNYYLIIKLLKKRKIHVLVVTPDVLEFDISSVPNFISFDDFFNKILDKINFKSVSELLKEIGRFMPENTILKEAYKNNINIYCPTFLDGNIKFNEKYSLNLVTDIKKINREAIFEENTGALICGTGMVKHHVLNANLFKDGLNYCVLINTAVESDGSDAGANIEEAVSWGKVKPKTSSVKIFCDPNIVFPLIVIPGFNLF